MSTIADLAAEVIIRCENKQADLPRAYVWVRDALIEIASDPNYRDDFDALEVLGPPFALTALLQEYNDSNIVPGGDVVDATLDIMIWTDYPTNTTRVRLDGTSYQDADRALLTSNGSLPTQWYRFGSSIGFYNIPDKPYQIQARVLRQHPLATPLQNTTILLPLDWDEIIEWAAVKRGYLEYLEFEKADQVHKHLFGDPKDPTKPGLVFGRKKRRAREDWRQTQSLRPVIRRYGWGRR